jgi:hypothetical protein
MRSSWSEFANSRSFSSEKTQIPGSGVGIAMIARSSLPVRASVALHPRKDRGLTYDVVYEVVHVLKVLHQYRYIWYDVRGSE